MMKIKCDQCSKISTVPFRSRIYNKLHSFCDGKCSNKAQKKGGVLDLAQRKRNLKKRGVEYTLQDPDVQLKRQQTCIKKYGVTNPFQANIIKERIRSANIEKYGVEWTSQVPWVQEKMKKTMIERYGHHNTFCDRDIWNLGHIARTGKTHEEFLETADEMRLYRNRVTSVSNAQPLHLLENSDKRGRDDHHLDHKFSVIDGFEKGILPDIVGHFANLQFIPAKENLLKGRQSSITINELMRKFDKYHD